MQKPAYYCDADGEMIGDKKHLSLSFGRFSGVAVPPSKIEKGEKRWKINPSIEGRFVHFHNTKCLADWFDKMIKKA